MRISDWSSDLCSSDLSPTPPRKGEWLRDLRRLAQLRELLQHQLALQPRQMVDEEDALQMVVLVLDARRHQPGHAFLMMLAVGILPVDGNLGGARHLGILFGDRQAALLIDAMFLALVREDGVDNDARIADKRLALFVFGIGFLQIDEERTRVV